MTFATDFSLNTRLQALNALMQALIDLEIMVRRTDRRLSWLPFWLVDVLFCVPSYRICAMIDALLQEAPSNSLSLRQLAAHYLSDGLKACRSRRPSPGVPGHILDIYPVPGDDGLSQGWHTLWSVAHGSQGPERRALLNRVIVWVAQLIHNTEQEARHAVHEQVQ